MTRYVVDASIAVKWVVPQPDSDRALALRDALLIAPDLLLAEAGHALWVYVHGRAMSPAEAQACHAELSRAPIRWLATRELAAGALALAVDLDHPVYDCVYLAAAIAEDAPLITADRRLVRLLHAHPAVGRYLMALSDVPQTS